LGFGRARVICPHGDQRVFPGAVSRFVVALERQDDEAELARLRKLKETSVQNLEPDAYSGEPS